MLFASNLQSGFGDFFISIIATLMALFVAMPFHEFAHALAARREGDYTATACGRFTLAPHAHFDWRGFLFLFLFRFGWAKPVPVDSRNFKHGRKSQFMVAIAGILANLILGILFLFVYMLVFKVAPEFYISNFYGELLFEFLSISISFNFMFVFFNILPIYPLDGYNIIDSFCRYENGFLKVMKEYSLFIYLILAFTGIYYYFYQITAGTLINLLMRLFSLILGLWYGTINRRSKVGKWRC